jgi:hypothetical protein
VTKFAIACFFVLATALAGAGAARAQDTMTGQWSIQRVLGSTVQLEFRTERRADGTAHWDSTNTSDVSRIGLSSADLDSSGKHVHFTIAREAGTFECDGWAGHGQGSGTFAFNASPAFLAGLRSRGYSDLSPEKQAGSAMLDITLGYIDSIFAAGYPHVEYNQLVAFKALGVTPTSIAALRSLFHDNLTAEELTSLAALHVTPAYISELRGLGIAPVSPQKAVELKALGVDKSYVQALAAAGYTNVPPDQLVQLKALGIDQAYIQHLAEHGMKNLTVSQLVRMKAVGL